MHARMQVYLSTHWITRHKFRGCVIYTAHIKWLSCSRLPIQRYARTYKQHQQGLTTHPAPRKWIFVLHMHVIRVHLTFLLVIVQVHACCTRSFTTSCERRNSWNSSFFSHLHLQWKICHLDWLSIDDESITSQHEKAIFNCNPEACLCIFSYLWNKRIIDQWSSLIYWLWLLVR